MATKTAEVYTHPILLHPGDELRLSPRGEPIVIKATTLLIWVDQAPDYRYAHPTYTVLIGAEQAEVIRGSWWIEVNGRRVPGADRQTAGLVSPVEFDGIAVHVIPTVVTPEHALMDGDQQPIPIERESVVLWVDLEPTSRFAHRTRYLVLDAAGGQVVDGQWWPTFGGRAKALGPAAVNPSRWQLDAAPLPVEQRPHEPVATVEAADIAPLKIDRKRASLTAIGTVPSLGWTDAALVRHVYVTPPADGIWGVEFVARPPEGPAAQQVSDVSASTSVDSLAGVAGFRVHARDGSLTIRVPELHTGEFVPDDPFEVLDVRFEADQLVIDVRYGGGCREHAFHMLWSGSLMRSNPPQARFFLVHDSQDDPCKALVHETLRFDMLDLPPLVLYVGDGRDWEVKLPYRLDE